MVSMSNNYNSLHMHDGLCAQLALVAIISFLSRWLGLIFVSIVENIQQVFDPSFGLFRCTGIL
jgi:hypothetical protein